MRRQGSISNGHRAPSFIFAGGGDRWPWKGGEGEARARGSQGMQPNLVVVHQPSSEGSTRRSGSSAVAWRLRRPLIHVGENGVVGTISIGDGSRNGRNQAAASRDSPADALVGGAGDDR